jgi:hypothetical protein
VRENVTDVGHLPIEMNRCNQPIFVATDIKHEKLPNSIDTAVRSLQISEVRKPVRLQELAP